MEKISNILGRSSISALAFVSGIGITQIESVPNVSVSSNEFVSHQYQDLTTMMKDGKFAPVKSPYEPTTTISHTANKTIIEFMSKDKTTETQISLQTGTSSGENLLSFNVSVYPGPHRLYSSSSIGDIYYSYSVFNTLTFRTNKNVWEVEEYGHDLNALDKELIGGNYYWGIEVPEMNPNGILKPIQISRLDGLFNQVLEVINDARSGKVVRDTPTKESNGYIRPHYRFVTP